ncbi:hypothetical protein NDU88_001245 [Pleurodeles waltl]|uniref:Uncharacterized protein n=1 Tax=Pleurodeles waltl TaxID=8319 RepID=A0AAV7NJI9_PLEWA|nr:hypothetical protein NDU88_001245 [Pleurodeles waltl]
MRLLWPCSQTRAGAYPARAWILLRPQAHPLAAGIPNVQRSLPPAAVQGSRFLHACLVARPRAVLVHLLHRGMLQSALRPRGTARRSLPCRSLSRQAQCRQSDAHAGGFCITQLWRWVLGTAALSS